VDVSPQLALLIEVALAWAQQTGGLLDPTVGAALIEAGYDADFDQMEKDQNCPAPNPTPAPGWQMVQLDGLTVRRPIGLLLDLGATAKAWCADRAAEAAADDDGASVLVSLGGDIATAGAVPPDGWVVRVADDHRASVTGPGQTVAIYNRGLATSSTGARRWRRGGQTVHHLIDPRTGGPCQTRWRTASVVGNSCLEANALSTSAIVAGDDAEGLLAGFRAPARMVSESDRALHLGGWPAADDELRPMARRRTIGRHSSFDL
jgi:thiamine biosynthesis lipoprotein